MTWQITEQGALFAIFITAFAWSGYQRGWRRETISLLYIVLGLVFLLLNDGVYLAKLLYQLLLNVNLSTSELTTSHPRFVLITSIFAVAIIIALGYIIGRRAFPKPPIPQDRVLGIIPGVITGAVVAAYVTYFLFSRTQTTLISASPSLNLSPALIANYMLSLIFVIALVVVIIGLWSIRLKKKH